MKHHYMSGDMKKPFIYNGIPCYCDKRYAGEIGLISSFEDTLKELV